MRTIFNLVVVLILLLSFAGCVPGSQPETKTTPTGKSETQAASTESEWEKLVAAANKEGTVSIYTTAGSAGRADITRAFKEKFGINTEFFAGAGPEITAKILNERRAGLYPGDVQIGGPSPAIIELKPVGVLDPLKPTLMLPEVLDLKNWFKEKYFWVDDEGTYMFGFTLFTSPYILINTDMAKDDDFKSYRDVLNPKWKNKIVINDPTVSGTGFSFFAVVGGLILGYDYMKELTTQEPVLLRDRRLQVEWVARGRYPLGLGADLSLISEFKKLGAPIKDLMPVEGGYLSSGSGNLTLFNRAAHPNAARVFINWFLGKEGQTVWSKATLNPSARMDVPREHVDQARVPVPGKPYIVDSEELRRKQPEQLKLAREIFGHLIK